MIRTFNVKVPFIGFDVVEIEIDDSDYSESEKEIILENAEEQAKDLVYETIKGNRVERFEFFHYVEGTNFPGFSEQKFEGFVEETTELGEEENE